MTQAGLSEHSSTRGPIYTKTGRHTSTSAALRASRYFDLTREYASIQGPLLILVAGLMGTGKSTVAEQLANRLGARVIRSDLVRKELAGIGPAARRFEAWDQGIYAAEHKNRTCEALLERAGEGLSRRETVILDASFGAAHWRDRARALASSAYAGFLAIETVATKRDCASA